MYSYLLPFHSNNGDVNGLKCYVCKHIVCLAGFCSHVAEVPVSIFVGYDTSLGNKLTGVS
jgi:hypothetical protein